MKRVNLIEQVANHLEFLGLGLCATEEQDGNIFWGHLPGSSASPLGWENWWVIPCGMFLDD